MSLRTSSLHLALAALLSPLCAWAQNADAPSGDVVEYVPAGWQRQEADEVQPRGLDKQRKQAMKAANKLSGTQNKAALKRQQAEVDQTIGDKIWKDPSRQLKKPIAPLRRRAGATAAASLEDRANAETDPVKKAELQSRAEKARKLQRLHAQKRLPTDTNSFDTQINQLERQSIGLQKPKRQKAADQSDGSGSK